MVRNYKDLDAWRYAMDLTEQCYRLTREFPKEELFGITSQIRRAAVSIPANIAEGQGRNTTREFAHFLGIARGSLSELETHLELASRFGFVDESKCADVMELAARVQRILAGLRKAVKAKIRSLPPHSP